MNPAQSAVEPAIVADNAAKLFLDGAVVAFHHPVPPGEIERACVELISLLG